MWNTGPLKNTALVWGEMRQKISELNFIMDGFWDIHLSHYAVIILKRFLHLYFTIKKICRKFHSFNIDHKCLIFIEI